MSVLQQEKASPDHTIGPHERGYGAAWRSSGAFAVALVLFELLASLLGVRSASLAALALVLAPGLALLPLLPRKIERVPLARLAAAPALGFAAISVALVGVTAVGMPLNGVTARIVTAALVATGLLLGRRSARGPEGEPEEGFGRLETGGLLLAVALGVLLAGRVLAGSPVPGNDWAKYLLYADEIRRHGSLLIDNPFWMLGVPFREDPGVPSVYGAVLSMSGAPASVLAHGLWIVAAGAILSVFAWVRAGWGPLAGVAAAGLWGVLPINQDILGWHGLPTLAALALIPLLAAYLDEVVGERLGWRQAAGAALIGVALLAAHRLSFLVAAAALGLAALVGLARGDRRLVLGNAARVLASAVPLGALVLADLIPRQKSFGGTQSYTAYLGTKVHLDRVAADLSWPFTAVALAALLALALRRLPARALGLPLALLAVVSVLAYGWVAHIPSYYGRMAYYLPIALVPLVAVALTELRWAKARPIVAVGLVVLVGALAWPQEVHVRSVYGFANRESLRGLDAVAARLRPGEVVATDRCWSFLTTWLLHTRTLPALDPADIQPKAEATFARQGRSVLTGGPEGLALGRRLGIRFLVVDPTCLDSRGKELRPPGHAALVYASRRLAIFER